MEKRFKVFLLVFWTFSFVSKGQNTGHLQKFNSNFFRGVNNYIIHNYSKSIKNLSEALIYNDTVAAAYYYLALDYHEKNMPEQKFEYIRRAIKLEPDEQVFRQLLEKWEEEEKNVSRDNAPEPTGPNSRSALEKSTVYKLIQQQKFEESYQTGKKLLEKYPYDVSLIYYTALAAYRTGKIDEARRLLENGMDFALTDKGMLEKFRQLLKKIQTEER